MTMFFGLRAADLWQDERGVNTIDTGAPYYNTYETKDGRWVAVGAIEPKFYAALLDRMGLGGADLPAQDDRERWPDLKRRFAEVFRAKTRGEWTEIMAGSDACFAPVLSLAEASEHPHNRARGSFIERDGIVQPAPAPRFSRTQAEAGPPPPDAGAHSKAALADWGFAPDEVADLIESGAVRHVEDAAA
jgi:alpha-methylacyl-CoA racemase